MQRPQSPLATEKFREVNEVSIRSLVDRFYERVREDVVLGPVFENALHGRWSEHLPKMVEFWSTMLLGTRNFQGNVYGKHMALGGVTPEHFVHWMQLFKAEVLALYDTATSVRVLEAADRVSGSLQLGFFGERPVHF